MSNTDRSPTTREKLSSIVDGFDEFDQEMKHDTKYRVDQDAFKILELKNEMKRLSTNLSKGVKMRTEMNKSTQTWFEEELEKVKNNFKETIYSRKENTDSQIKDMNEKITDFTNFFDDQKAEIIKNVDDRGAELEELLNKFNKDFEEDRRLRLEREAYLNEQLEEHEISAKDTLEEQCEYRTMRYQAIKAGLDENIRLRDKYTSRFQSFLEKEILLLKKEFLQEAKMREREDDEIVEALNQYTLKLQSSLKIVNSTDG